MASEQLENMLDAVDTFEESFYARTIQLHNDGRMRHIAKFTDNNRIKVYHDGGDMSIGLYYTTNGFQARQKVQDRNRSNSWQEVYFIEKDAKLVLDEENNREMLELFPNFSYELIEAIIQTAVSELPIYKNSQHKSSEAVARIFAGVK